MEIIGPKTYKMFMQEPLELAAELQAIADEVGGREGAVRRIVGALARVGVVDVHPKQGLDSATTSRERLREAMAAWNSNLARPPRDIGGKSLLLLGALCYDEASLAALSDLRHGQKAQAAEAERMRTKRMRAFSTLRVEDRTLEVITPSDMRDVMYHEKPEAASLRFYVVCGAIADTLQPEQPPLQRAAGSLVCPSGVVYTDTYKAGGRMDRSVAILPQHFESGYTRVLRSGQEIPGFTARAQEATEFYIAYTQELLQQES